MLRKLFILSIPFLLGISVYGQGGIQSETLKQHVYYLASDSLEGRGLATESGLKAARYIADYFKSNGLMPVGDSYFHPFHARIGQTVLEGRNVVGMIEGSDPELKNEYIVLGAHYDHIAYRINENNEKVVYNGADDNASGTAAVMEIGRLLAGQKGKLKRSVVLVAFDGEESGLIGSGKFVRNGTISPDQIKIMFSIDMIGRYAESNSVIMGAMEDLKDGAKRLMVHADEYDIKIKRTGGETSMRTDTKPFGDAGIPAVYVTSGIVGPYHQPEDDRETLDYDGMEKISNMLLDLTVDLANGESLVAQKQFTSNVEPGKMPFFRYGVKANIGGSSNTYPDEFYKGKSRFSYEIGLTSQFRLSNNISLQPEVLYSMMGSKHADGKLRLHSVTTPVSLVLASAMDPTMQQRFFASFGGYYSYHFAGSVSKQVMDFNNEYNQTEAGIVYGIGLELMSVFVAVNFKHGLTNILQDNNMGRIRNRGMYFTLGYIF